MQAQIKAKSLAKLEKIEEEEDEGEKSPIKQEIMAKPV